MKTTRLIINLAALLGVVFTAEMPPSPRINPLAAKPITTSLHFSL